jgi:hypothetical protein
MKLSGPVLPVVTARAGKMTPRIGAEGQTLLGNLLRSELLGELIMQIL